MQRTIEGIVKKAFFHLGLEIRRRQDSPNQQSLEYRSTRLTNVFDMGNTQVDIYRYASSATSEKITSFKSKLETGAYTIQFFPCPICGNRDTWLLVATSREGFQWDICKSCGLLQNSHRLPREQLNKFYNLGEYQEICMAGLDDETHFRIEHEVTSIRSIDIFRKLGYELANLKIIEIGCGSGGILLAMKERGATVKGFDIDEHRVRYGQKYLNEIEVGDAMDYGLDLSLYDIVLVSGVIEHLFDPQQFLLDLGGKMKNTQGKVLIHVPNLEGAHDYSDQSFLDFLHIGHIWYFTSLSLERLLNQAGFKIDYIFNRGQVMGVLSHKADDIVLNSNNSLMLSISSIYYANYKHDKHNVGAATRKALQNVCSGVNTPD